MRLIDADGLKVYHGINVGANYGGLREIVFKRDIDIAPTIEERKTGRWLKTGQSFVFPDKFRNYFCSECGFEIEKTAYNYCPVCGADMRGEDNG